MKKLLVYLGILAGGGLLFGFFAYVALPDEQVLALQQYLSTQMQTLSTTMPQSEAASRIFRANAMDLLRVYLAGICLLGLPILLILLFIKAFTLGFSACFLLQYSPLLLFTRFLQLPVLLLAAAFGCRFAFLMIQNRLDSPARHLLQYTVLFGLLLVGTFLFSYVDGLSSSQYLYHFAGLLE